MANEHRGDSTGRQNGGNAGGRPEGMAGDRSGQGQPVRGQGQAAGRQGAQPAHQGGQNAGAGGRPGQEGQGQPGGQAQGIATGAMESMGQFGGRMREGMHSAGEHMAHGYRRAEGMVARNPAPSLALGFGIGFGLGLALTMLLSRREETWWERNLPEGWSRLPDRLREMPDRIRDMDLAHKVSKHFG